jgi:hypothetical protein
MVRRKGCSEGAERSGWEESRRCLRPGARRPHDRLGSFFAWTGTHKVRSITGDSCLVWIIPPFFSSGWTNTCPGLSVPGAAITTRSGTCGCGARGSITARSSPCSARRAKTWSTRACHSSPVGMWRKGLERIPTWSPKSKRRPRSVQSDSGSSEITRLLPGDFGRTVPRRHNVGYHRMRRFQANRGDLRHKYNVDSDLCELSLSVAERSQANRGDFRHKYNVDSDLCELSLSVLLTATYVNCP